MHYKEKIIIYAEKLNLDNLSQLSVFLNSIQLNDYSLYQSIKQQTIQRIKEVPQLQQYSLSQLTTSLAKFDVQRKLEAYSKNFESLTDTNLIISLFPRLVFLHDSANYYLYSRICKLILKEKKFIGSKWLCLNIYGIASVEYRNYNYIENILDYVLN